MPLKKRREDVEMTSEILTNVRPFIAATEVWVPKDDKLTFYSGSYGDLTDFADASHQTSFVIGEGLPGKAWAKAKPIVFKELKSPVFLRAEAAAAAGLTSAVAVPIFSGETLKAVLVVLCTDDDVRMGAIEVWVENNGLMLLDDGYYGAAKHFEWVSQHTHFPKGQGLPGGVWSSATPMLMRDLGSGYRFIRADSAGKAGLTTGLGLPISSPAVAQYVLTLLSARGTPIARRFEIWDARKAKVGNTNTAVLIDGICEKDGALWDDENPRKATAWQGVVGRVIGSGLPVVEDSGVETLSYGSVVAMPIYEHGELAFVVSWYC